MLKKLLVISALVLSMNSFAETMKVHIVKPVKKLSRFTGFEETFAYLKTDKGNIPLRVVEDDMGFLLEDNELKINNRHGDNISLASFDPIRFEMAWKYFFIDGMKPFFSKLTSTNTVEINVIKNNVKESKYLVEIKALDGQIICYDSEGFPALSIGACELTE